MVFRARALVDRRRVSVRPVFRAFELSAACWNSRPVKQTRNGILVRSRGSVPLPKYVVFVSTGLRSRVAVCKKKKPTRNRFARGSLPRRPSSGTARMESCCGRTWRLCARCSANFFFSYFASFIRPNFNRFGRISRPRNHHHHLRRFIVIFRNFAATSSHFISLRPGFFFIYPLRYYRSTYLYRCVCRTYTPRICRQAYLGPRF